MCGRCFGSVFLKLLLSKCVLACCKGHYRPVANSMSFIRCPAIDCRLKHLTRKFSTTMLEVDAGKAAVTSNRIAIPITEKLVFAFDGVKTRWNMAPVRIHRADLAKHCKGARGTGQCIPAYWLAILSARVRFSFASVRQ